jgi:glycolate oxidase
MVKDSLLNQLREIVGERYVLTDPVDLTCYAYDSTFEEHCPEAVVLPGSTEEVSEVVKAVGREGVPLVARGMGSGLAGASIAFEGGIVLTLTRMNRLLEIDQENMTATAQAGIITADLQEAVGKHGLIYPPDPSSQEQSTLGGNAACCAGGPKCLKYGVTKDYVMALEAVLADGQVLRTGGKTVKNVTGYDLVQLFIGSEGTLGIITELTVRLLPKPEATYTAKAVFDHLEDASEAVNKILLAGVMPSKLEIMDDTTIRCVEDHLCIGLPIDAAAILIIETDGDEQTALREIKVAAQVCRDIGAREVDVATTPEEADELWRARRSVSGSLGRIRPNKLGEDVAVPRSAIPDMVRRIKEIAVERDLPIVVFGHAGDGNLHPNILFDRRDEEEMRRVEAAVKDIFEAAVELGGTLSGEHGVGALKREYLEMAVGSTAVQVMRDIKAALDPQCILNPGKIFTGYC